MAASYQIRNILAAGQSEPGYEAHAAVRHGQTVISPTNGWDRGSTNQIDLDEHVERSVRTVERAVENFGALKENCQYYKNMAADLRDGLEQERAERQEADRVIDDLDRQIRAERERAGRADARAAVAELRVKDLERELDAIRAQTERLVQTIAQLVAAESEARGDHDALQRLAA